MIEFITEHYGSLIIGLLVSVSISFFAYKKQSLSTSGFYASIVVGTIIYVCGGLYFMVVLFAFFVSSSLFSVLQKGEKRHAKRTYKQVLANGVIGVVLSILFFTSKEELFKLLYTISFAVSTADTWASEIGKLAKYSPRHILTWKSTTQGLSGSVSGLGLFASLGGSVFMSVFMLFNYHVIIWGFLGSILDSVLGTIQVKYVLSTGEVLDRINQDQTYDHTTGLPWLKNNTVNFISNLIIVAVVYILYK